VRVAVVSSFPPRLCGIATFASHLNAALAALDVHVMRVTVVNDRGLEQQGIIRRDIRADYEKEAERLNALRPDVVLIQHEYGLFGGRYGSHLLALSCCLQVPIAIVFHTVLPSPDDALRKVTTQLASLSRVVVVMCGSAARLLATEYGVPDRSLTVLSHGYPELRDQPKPHRMRSAGGGRGAALLSVGLLGPNKGIEAGISAMALVLQHFPHARYFVVGSTHPSEIDHGIDGYRATLVAQAHEHGVEHAVVFVDGYLTLEEHVAWIQHADLVLIPHRDLRQVSSGTLAYSVGAGRAVVCTPFAYALELASAEAGLVLSAPSASDIASAIIRVLSDPWLHAQLMDQSATVARGMSWPRVAEAYLAALACL